MSENEQSKGSRMKTSLQISRNNFFLQEPFYSLREKKRSNHTETHGEMRGALALPWVTLAGPVWWKECENLRAGTFPFIFFFLPLMISFTHPAPLTVHGFRTGSLTKARSPNWAPNSCWVSLSQHRGKPGHEALFKINSCTSLALTSPALPTQGSCFHPMEQEWIPAPHVFHGFKDILAPSLQCFGQLWQINRFGFIQLGKRKLLSKTESVAEQLGWLHLSLDGEWSVLGELPSLEALWATCAGHWKESTAPWHFILDIIAVLAKPQFG